MKQNLEVLCKKTYDDYCIRFSNDVDKNLHIHLKKDIETVVFGDIDKKNNENDINSSDSDDSD